MTANHSLFNNPPAYQPLAARMRPTCLSEVLGQEHLLADGKPLRQAIDHSSLHSMILWGPPGVGKTTIARLIAELCDVHFEAISAVLSGVKEIRAAIQAAEQQRLGSRKTLLFVDEVHRFNKAQQDAFLPFVEDGTVVFIGATTENPSFELNNALLSRARVYKLRSIDNHSLFNLLQRALQDQERGLGGQNLSAADDVLQTLAKSAQGDGRRALNVLEVAADLAEDGCLTTASIEEALGGDFRQFDKGGDLFYEQISALHKAVRGSSPDAALYWFARMLDGGCDPLYIARRLVRMASEDIGNADPRAMALALDAWQVQERLGSPEGDLALAQAVVYLSVAAKSNAVYKAHGAAMAAVRETGSLEVPMHIRNAPTTLMKDMGYGDDYQYAHDHDGGFVPGENYLPQQLEDAEFYVPVNRGMEIQIGEKLAKLRAANRGSDFQRYQSDKDQT
tara:strand:+ start:9945 stop:11294 length:1350 start_codon:yes stop_codon:yes gene_type:complete